MAIQRMEDSTILLAYAAGDGSYAKGSLGWHAAVYDPTTEHRTALIECTAGMTLSPSTSTMAEMAAIWTQLDLIYETFAPQLQAMMSHQGDIQSVYFQVDLYSDCLPAIEAILDVSYIESRGDIHLIPLQADCRRCIHQLQALHCHANLRRPTRGRHSRVINDASDPMAKKARRTQRGFEPVPRLVNLLQECSNILAAFDRPQREVAL